MNLILKLKLFWFLSLLISICGDAQAHELKTAFTTILFNDRSGNLEIMHRFSVHDAEHAIKILLNSKSELIDNKQSQKKFGEYVQAHFQLRSDGQNKIDLTYVGHEVEGDNFWVYQEIKMPAPLTKLDMTNSAMQSIWKDHVNIVNIEGRGKIKSLRFTAKDKWLSVRL